MPEFFTPLGGGRSRQILQRVVECGPAGAEALYLRRENESVSTATYINLFHAKRWRDLTGLESFTLELSAQGSGWVVVFGHSGPADRQPEELYAVHLGSEPSLTIFPLGGGHDFYYFDWEPDQP